MVEVRLSLRLQVQHVGSVVRRIACPLMSSRCADWTDARCAAAEGYDEHPPRWLLIASAKANAVMPMLASC